VGEGRRVREVASELAVMVVAGEVAAREVVARELAARKIVSMEVVASELELAEEARWRRGWRWCGWRRRRWW
jgi:hypothetical protein